MTKSDAICVFSTYSSNVYMAPVGMPVSLYVISNDVSRTELLKTFSSTQDARKYTADIIRQEHKEYWHRRFSK